MGIEAFRKMADSLSASTTPPIPPREKGEGEHLNPTNQNQNKQEDRLSVVAFDIEENKTPRVSPVPTSLVGRAQHREMDDPWQIEGRAVEPSGTMETGRDWADDRHENPVRSETLNGQLQVEARKNVLDKRIANDADIPFVLTAHDGKQDVPPFESYGEEKPSVDVTVSKGSSVPRAARAGISTIEEREEKKEIPFLLDPLEKPSSLSQKPPSLRPSEISKVLRHDKEGTLPFQSLSDPSIGVNSGWNQTVPQDHLRQIRATREEGDSIKNHFHPPRRRETLVRTDKVPFLPVRAHPQPPSNPAVMPHTQAVVGGPSSTVVPSPFKIAQPSPSLTRLPGKIRRSKRQQTPSLPKEKEAKSGTPVHGEERKKTGLVAIHRRQKSSVSAKMDGVPLAVARVTSFPHASKSVAKSMASTVSSDLENPAGDRLMWVHHLVGANLSRVLINHPGKTQTQSSTLAIDDSYDRQQPSLGSESEEATWEPLPMTTSPAPTVDSIEIGRPEVAPISSFVPYSGNGMSTIVIRKKIRPFAFSPSSVDTDDPSPEGNPHAVAQTVVHESMPPHESTQEEGRHIPLHFRTQAGEQSEKHHPVGDKSSDNTQSGVRRRKASARHVPIENLGTGIVQLLGEAVGSVVSAGRATTVQQVRDEPVTVQQTPGAESRRIVLAQEVDHGQRIKNLMSEKVGGGVQGLFSGMGMMAKGGANIVVGSLGCLGGALICLSGVSAKSKKTKTPTTIVHTRRVVKKPDLVGMGGGALV